MVVKSKEYLPTKSSYDKQVSALALCVAVNASPVIWGPPGAGKTSILNAIAAANGLHLEQILASTKEPPDFSGFPFIDKGVMRLAPPAWASNIVNVYRESKRPSIAFFDEISTAAPATQAALLTTILDRRAGETQLPMSTRMIAAANPPKIAANGWDMTAPMANRFTHLDWELDNITIARGLQIGWSSPDIPRLPSNIKSLIKNAEILVGSYIESKPDAIRYDFSSFSGNAAKSEFHAAINAWPSARSWTVAAKLYAAGQAAKNANKEPLHKDVTRLLIEGTVGVAQAQQFLTYTESLDLPNPQDILRDPDNVEIPTRLDKISAVLASVQNASLAYKDHPSYSHVWNAWGDFLTRIVDIGKADHAFPFIKQWLIERPSGVGISDKHNRSFRPLIDAFKDVYPNA
ncbi:MAG: AAA family ATPase [Enterococcus sp.]|nr:AAA family ATPase [Enterococcus sp.]